MDTRCHLFAVWHNGTPSSQEIKALRFILPAYASRPLAELRQQLLVSAEYDLGEFEEGEAMDLHWRAQTQGLRLSIRKSA
jgi:hypothetical protein